MLMTMSMLEYQLSFNWPVKRNRKAFENRGLRTAMLWQETNIRKDVLYLITPEQFERAGKLTVGCNLLCPGPVDTGDDRGRCNCLYLERPADMTKLFNDVQDIFLQYSDWLAGIDETLRETRNPDPVLKNSAAYLHAPLTLWDDNYIVLGTGGEGQYSRSQRMTLELQNELTQEDEYTDVKEHRGVFEYGSFTPGTNLVCYNLYVHEAYFARLVCTLPADILLDGPKQFTEYLGSRLAGFYESQDSEAQRKDREELRQTLLALLKGETIEQNAVERALGNRGWKTAHQYQVLKFYFLMDVSLDYYRSQLEQLFPDCLTVLLDNSIYLVYNLSPVQTAEQEHVRLQRFAAFLRDSLCKAGISNPCTNIFWLYNYRLEADAALRIGRNRQETFWYYRFSDYAMEYIAEAATEKLSAWNLAHPAIRYLLAYDEKNEGEMVKTLLTYIEQNCSASEAARTLFIHRTTLIHRMEKIQELTAIDLDDAAERLHLQLSYYLLYQNGEL